MSGSHRSSGKSRKREGGAAEDDGIELTDLRADAASWVAATRPLQSGGIGGIYDMDKAADREQLAADIWRLPFDDSLEELRAVW